MDVNFEVFISHFYFTSHRTFIVVGMAKLGPVISIDDEWYNLEKWADNHPGGKLSLDHASRSVLLLSNTRD